MGTGFLPVPFRYPSSTVIKGSLDATLAANLPSAPISGDMYVISVAGDFESDASITPVGITFDIGNFIVYDGGTALWSRIDTTEPTMEEISNTVITTPANDEILAYAAGDWVNTTVSAVIAPPIVLSGTTASYDLLTLKTSDDDTTKLALKVLSSADATLASVTAIGGVTGTSMAINQAADLAGLTVYGYDDKAADYCKVMLGAAGETYLDFSTYAVWRIAGSAQGVFGNGFQRLDDSKVMAFGSGSDYGICYRDATDSLEIMDGITPGSNIRITLDNTGKTSFAGAVDIDGIADTTQLSVTGMSTQTGTTPIVNVSGGTNASYTGGRRLITLRYSDSHTTAYGTITDGSGKISYGSAANASLLNVWYSGSQPDRVTVGSVGPDGTGMARMGVYSTGNAGTSIGLSVHNASNTLGYKVMDDGGVVIMPAVVAGGSRTAHTITGAANTTCVASTEAPDVYWNLARTVQFATGAITAQRAIKITAPTYSAVGASVMTTGSTLSISGPPVAGTNMTITNSYALNVESGITKFPGTSLVNAAGDFTNPGGQTSAEVFGAGALVTSNNASVFGNSATAGQWGNAFGYNAHATGIGAISIGYGNATGSSGYCAIGIGHLTIANGDYSIILGEQGTAGGNNHVFVVGRQANATAANQIVFGDVQGPFTSMYIGEGVTSTTPQAILISATGGSGSGVAGSTMTIAGGAAGSGDADGGGITLAPAAAAGAGTKGVLTLDYAAFPATDAAGFLKSDGAGNLSWDSSSVDIGDAISGSSANRILYMNGSNVLANSSAFTFDGTNVVLTGASRNFSAPGGQTAGEQYGANADAAGSNCVAIGNSSKAHNSSVAVGKSAQTASNNSIVIGASATSSGTSGGIAIGYSTAAGNKALALGYDISAGTDSMKMAWGSATWITGNSAGKVTFNGAVTATGAFTASSTVTTTVGGLGMDASGNTTLGLGQLADAATDGFAYMPTTTSGVPSGVPTAKTGYCPFVYDDTNDTLYVYNSGWKGVTLS